MGTGKLYFGLGGNVWETQALYRLMVRFCKTNVEYHVYNKNERTNERQENDDTLQKQWIDRTDVSDECLRYRDS
jgi:hypothetical protein